MPDYNNSKVYKIYCLNNPDLVYVGSTTQKLSQRLADHIKHCKYHAQGKPQYCSSYEVINKGNYRIELIEEYSCENKEQLLKREGHYIRKFNCVNKLVAGRTQKQYYEDNKEQILKYNKQYVADHKEHVQEYKKQHYTDNKEVVLQKCKKYYEENTEAVKARVNKYRIENAEAVKARKSKIVVCEKCGKQSTASHLRRHQRTTACEK